MKLHSCNASFAGMAAHRHHQGGPQGVAGVARLTLAHVPPSLATQNHHPAAGYLPLSEPLPRLCHPAQLPMPRFAVQTPHSKCLNPVAQEAMYQAECMSGKQILQLQMSSQASEQGQANGTSRSLSCLLLSSHQHYRYRLLMPCSIKHML